MADVSGECDTVATLAKRQAGKAFHAVEYRISGAANFVRDVNNVGRETACAFPDYAPFGLCVV